MELEHLFAAIAATRQHCEEQQQAIDRARLGRAAQDVDLLASDIVPAIEQAKLELQSKGVEIAISPAFGPGTRNEPRLEIFCRPTGKWSQSVTNARGHRVTITCRAGNLDVSSAPAHSRIDSPVERENADEPLTGGAAAQLAVDRAVLTLMTDADARAAPQPTRGMDGDPSFHDAAVR